MLPLKVTTPASLRPLSSPPSFDAKNQPTFLAGAPLPEADGAARLDFGTGFLAGRLVAFFGLMVITHRFLCAALPFAFANSARQARANSATSGIVTEFPICL